jgi:hypothetical protein
VQIGRELIEQMRPYSDGMYIVAPMNKCELAMELVEFAKAKKQ